jgi:hypothetical protein
METMQVLTRGLDYLSLLQIREGNITDHKKHSLARVSPETDRYHYKKTTIYSSIKTNKFNY